MRSLIPSNLHRQFVLRSTPKPIFQVFQITRMSHVQSHACCNTPAVVSKGYEQKGSYITVNGTKTYATGNQGAKKAILMVYDIFGFFPQTIQGADILASGDKENPYQVFMPDFFDGEPADISWYPPKTDEAGQKLGKFFETKAAPPKTLERVPGILEEIKKNNPSIESWGVLGFCWGGKIANLLSTKDSLFKSAASVHPAMVDANDAKDTTIPFLLCPSEGESKEDVEKWEKAITVKHAVEPFYDQLHGWMAARANLENPDELKAYEKGYNVVLNWFHTTL